jgi:hypothetical protein
VAGLLSFLLPAEVARSAGSTRLSPAG